MKKILLLICTITLFWFSIINTFAYNPTTGDKQKVEDLKLQLSGIIQENNEDLWHFYYQIKSLQRDHTFDQRIDYMLSSLFFYLRDKMNARKKIAQVLSKDYKKDFVDDLKDNIVKNDDIYENCLWWYQTLDDISFAYNYPTALLIASRYRETNCGYYLPSNGDGPFQILNEDYGTGEITEDIFVQSVIDYIEFSRNKYERYERANKADEDPKYKFKLSYTGVDYTGIVRHWALYNGLSGYTVYGDAKPMKPSYVFDGYEWEFADSLRFGILPKTIKILDRELANKY